jgi:hypothetical protein
MERVTSLPASPIAETFPAYRQAGSLGENAAAGQECPAYRIFEIAAFIPAYRAGHSKVLETRLPVSL